jgi:hypothetical protein
MGGAQERRSRLSAVIWFLSGMFSRTGKTAAVRSNPTSAELPRHLSQTTTPADAGAAHRATRLSGFVVSAAASLVLVMANSRLKHRMVISFSSRQLRPAAWKTPSAIERVRKRPAEQAARDKALSVIERLEFAARVRLRARATSATIRTAIIADTPWLDVCCPGCRMSRARNIRALHRHSLVTESSRRSTEIARMPSQLLSLRTSRPAARRAVTRVPTWARRPRELT